jgi:hypothetical protein
MSRCYLPPVARVSVGGEMADACGDHVLTFVDDDGAEIVDTYDTWDAPADRRAVYAALNAEEGQRHE